MNMKWYLISLLLCIFSACNRNSDIENQQANITFIPTFDYELTPLSARSSEQIADTNIVGLIYQNKKLTNIITYKDNKFEASLHCGEYYTFVFLANATPFLYDIEDLGTAKIVFDTLHASHVFGAPVFMHYSSLNYILPRNEAKPIQVDMQCVTNLFQCTSFDEVIPTDLIDVTSTLTNINPILYLDYGKYNNQYKTVTVTSDASANYGFHVYHFSDLFHSEVDLNLNYTDDVVHLKMFQHGETVYGYGNIQYYHIKFNRDE